jgi:hypothetical protein
VAVVRALIACFVIVVSASGQPVSCEHGTLRSLCLSRIGPLAVAWERSIYAGPLAAISSPSVGGVVAFCRISVVAAVVLAGRVSGSVVLWKNRNSNTPLTKRCVKGHHFPRRV